MSIPEDNIVVSQSTIKAIVEQILTPALRTEYEDLSKYVDELRLQLHKMDERVHKLESRPAEVHNHTHNHYDATPVPDSQKNWWERGNSPWTNIS